jgi:antirestriction protein ArdC
MNSDVYQRVTDSIVSQMERGVRPWFLPWKGDHAAGRITRPLRANGVPYRGINVVMLWGAAVEKGYAAPIWMTVKQAHELVAHVRKGERGSLVVYANTITRTETNEETGEENEHAIPFMKGYAVFNVEQIGGGRRQVPGSVPGARPSRQIVTATQVNRPKTQPRSAC